MKNSNTFLKQEPVISSSFTGSHDRFYTTKYLSTLHFYDEEAISNEIGMAFFFSNRSNYMNSLLSAMADAFRGHGFSLLVATLLRGLFAHAVPAEVAAFAPINSWS
ncbi:hypothetical protein H131_01698 [Lysinibacillus sphaericus OT4b.31]|uniref:Uncharacterized protein n=1 Tax=Lysinibacillus sphaericus OT4b.31 TaxID=1285586 RepID=R7ZJ77_LYSSH|nr:hypothetical protein H131_01698 [Lysinibacillus sphaericus OT4b.31]